MPVGIILYSMMINKFRTCASLSLASIAFVGGCASTSPTVHEESAVTAQLQSATRTPINADLSKPTYLKKWSSDIKIMIMGSGPAFEFGTSDTLHLSKQNGYQTTGILFGPFQPHDVFPERPFPSKYRVEATCDNAETSLGLSEVSIKVIVDDLEHTSYRAIVFQKRLSVRWSASDNLK